MVKNYKDEYYFLTEKLDEIEWALEGKCNDIDCNKYMYKDLLKKRYKPVLEHNFSCVKKLKIDKLAIMGILSQQRYKPFRYTKCHVCGINLDKLNKNNKIVGFTRKIIEKKNNYYEWKGFWVHCNCEKKVKIPVGWNKR
ncbi:hypothetical protein HYW74_01240 [Candidatus Pacearchaeota archaeon]|nr:hypothetical protein [Candidatus Pacearchaeota archaeon]